MDEPTPPTSPDEPTVTMTTESSQVNLTTEEPTTEKPSTTTTDDVLDEPTVTTESSQVNLTTEEPTAEPVGFVCKSVCLAVMTVVAAALTLTQRYTRTASLGLQLYFPTTVVCMAEVIKLMASLGLLAKETGSPSRLKDSLVEHVFRSPGELLKLSIPSCLYALQNNLVFLALSNLDAAVFQAAYQAKTAVTAVLSYFMLRRLLSPWQWFSVLVLCGGVVLVQWKPADVTDPQMEQNHLYGILYTLGAALCSGIAGVYTEKVVKSSDTSLWVRNIQMYLSGIVITLAYVYWADCDKVLAKGFFFGYTPLVGVVLFLSSVGGVLVSMVVKYTSNITKGFSSAAAILLSTVASYFMFGLQITATVLSGGLLVIASIFLYRLPKQCASWTPGNPTSNSKLEGVIATSPT